MHDQKRTLMVRLRKNLARLITRPLAQKPPKEFAEEELVDLEEFTGLPREEVLRYLQRDKGRRISNEFDWLAPKCQEEYAWFYRGSRTYLFASEKPWERAIEVAQPGWRCLDFGGGGGRNALGMAAAGAEVFYVDIGIINGAFASFRARKRGLDLTIIDPMVEKDGAWTVDTAEAARRVGGFDLIVCDNVLEHVPEYHVVLEKLVAALSPRGKILECTPFRRDKTYVFKRPPEWDIHLSATMPMAEAMASCGMQPVDGVETGLWERATATPTG